MRISVDIDKDLYDYLRYRHIDIESLVDTLLRRKFRLGKISKRPLPTYPLPKSVEYGIEWMNTDPHNPQSILELVNLIMSIYPLAKEEDVFKQINISLNKKHKYDKFK